MMKLMGSLNGYCGKQAAALAAIGCCALLYASVLVISKSSYVLPFRNLGILLPNFASSENLTTGTEPSNPPSDSRNVSKPPTKLMCNTNKLPKHCELEGDVRVHGSSLSVVLNASESGVEIGSWNITPYARLYDVTGLVTQVSVRSLSNHDQGPHCAVRHSVPAVVFSVGGYTGNLFHDFAEVLIPLFLVSHRYHGEVQFLVTDMKPWWIYKYRMLLARLSRYDIINFDKDDTVRCFPRVNVGMQTHMELNIDPLLPPPGYTMTNFTDFVRRSYSLERVNVHGHIEKQKPRLLIIARNRTRSFMNTANIADMANEVGYETLVMEPAIGTELAQLARIVNSCDVIVGVHGAGLTNMFFLPMNAVLVQIAPWGFDDTKTWLDFGRAALISNLTYLKYEASVEESSLVDEYPRDHPSIKDPESIYKQGWREFAKYYLGQNVKLNVTRFRGVLEEALKALHYSKD